MSIRWSGLAAIAGVAVLLGGCAHYGGHGLARVTRLPAMDCAALDAERAHVEAATSALYAHALRARAFGPQTGAGLVDNWPTRLFARDRGPKDRQRYQQLSLHYEQLRIAARQKQCALTFASDVSRTVRVNAAAGG